MSDREVTYLESERQCEKNTADTHEYITPHDEDFPSQTFNKHTL